MFRSFNGVETDDVDYDDCLSNNNDINNDTTGCISVVENDYSSTAQYINNNISFIDTDGVIGMHLIYNFVAFLIALDTIYSSIGRSFICLSSKHAPVLSLSSNIFHHLSSDCGRVHLGHVSVALVASLETISSLSHILISVFF